LHIFTLLQIAHYSSAENGVHHGYNPFMEANTVKPPVWVATDREIVQLAAQALRQPRIAVDTESNSLFAYQEKVCLIQVSTPETDYLIDPFAFSDLSPLAPVFADANVEKIFHAAEYDILCLKRDYHFEFHGIFDSMIASRILGLTEIGLGSLLLNRFGIEIDKRYQRANWGIRPLSAAMLSYAALDTHYLFQLRDSLDKDLLENDLKELAEEDFRYISRVEGHKPNGSGTNCWKVAGASRLTPRQAAILDQLCNYRDEQARKADLPHFKVLANKLLVDLCQAEVTAADDILKVEGMSKKLLQRHGAGLMRALQMGQSAAPVIKPRKIHPPDDQLIRMERLKEWRKKTALELKVESDVVLPKDEMEAIAYHNPQNLVELAELMTEIPVRYKKYGQKILDALTIEETI
jgi:ribonuclease D